MSERERKLLVFFGIVGFAIINILAWKFYSSQKAEAVRQLASARGQLEKAIEFRTSSEQIADEMEWLAKHEPEPAAEQDVKSKLQQVCDAEAKTSNLTIIPPEKIQETDVSGRYFHRAKIKLMVTGTEQALFQWFDRLNSPEQLRQTTYLMLAPNKKEPTQIDCTAMIEQWFVPPSSN